jgi:DNA-binding XRE family transcriptional regulator
MEQTSMAMANGRQLPVIAIQRKANGRLVPLISGRQWNKLEAVAECLFDNLGRGVPYKRLLTVIGRKSDDASSRHLLRQYISTLREMLLADNSPYFVTVIKEVGYGLCELAKNPRHTVSVRRDDGASETGKTVRQLRIAAGLTQTALAKRAGMDRTHLNRLERGRLIPTLITLKRLAKTLQVTPRSLL